MLEEATPASQRFGIRSNIFLVTSLAFMMGHGHCWLDIRGQKLIDQDQAEGADTAAISAISALKSIMLVIYGDPYGMSA